MIAPPAPRTSGAIDQHIGNRLRQRRKLLNMSQTDLATGLGLTFQQVQKYERGANRISASKLYEAGHILKVPVAYFYDGLEVPEGDAATTEAEAHARASIAALLDTPEGLDLATTFPKITRGATRRQVASLVRTLADEE